MDIVKVTNNYSGALFIAGTSVRAGATVGIEKDKFERWASQKNVQVYFEQDIVTVEGSSEDTSEGEDTSEQKTKKSIKKETNIKTTPENKQWPQPNS